jgi:hypothetical protein
MRLPRNFRTGDKILNPPVGPQGRRVGGSAWTGSAKAFPIGVLLAGSSSVCKPLRRHADTPTRRHADTPTRRHADTPLRRYADTPYVDPPLNPSVTSVRCFSPLACFWPGSSSVCKPSLRRHADTPCADPPLNPSVTSVRCFPHWRASGPEARSWANHPYADTPYADPPLNPSVRCFPLRTLLAPKPRSRLTRPSFK